MASNPPTPEEDLQVPDSEEEDGEEDASSEDYSEVPDSLEEGVEASEDVPDAEKASAEENPQLPSSNSEDKESSVEESSEEEEEDASAEESSEEEEEEDEDLNVKPSSTIPKKRRIRRKLEGKESKRVKEDADQKENDTGEGGNVESLVKKDGMESQKEKLEIEKNIELLKLFLQHIELKKDIAKFRHIELKQDIAKYRQKALRLSYPCFDHEGPSSCMRDASILVAIDIIPEFLYATVLRAAAVMASSGRASGLSALVYARYLLKKYGTVSSVIEWERQFKSTGD